MLQALCGTQDSNATIEVKIYLRQSVKTLCLAG